MALGAGCVQLPTIHALGLELEALRGSYGILVYDLLCKYPEREFWKRA